MARRSRKGERAPAARRIAAKPLYHPRVRPPRRPRPVSPRRGLSAQSSGDVSGASLGVWMLLPVSLVFVALGMTPVADMGEAHYMRAKELVVDFERGKSPAMIAYDHPVYGLALDELGRIEAESRYYEPARKMEADLRSRIDSFERRRTARRLEVRDLSTERIRRREAFAESRRMRRLDPGGGVSVCEDVTPPPAEDEGADSGDPGGLGERSVSLSPGPSGP